MNIAEAILDYADALPEGAPITATSLLHLGARASINQSLSRLVKRGELIRAGRGLYARPVVSRFGTRAPAPERFVELLSAQTSEVVAPNGAAAANLLGLTTQNPIVTVYLTSGRSRSLSLGKQTIELRHAPRWMLQRPAEKSGHALRALAWIGPERASAAVDRIKAELSAGEIRDLLALRPSAPGWLARILSALAV